MIIGELNDRCREIINLKDGEFFKNDVKMLDDDLKEWAIWLNSPWSYTNHRYEIFETHINYSDKGVDPDKKWTCRYTVTGYDGITAILYAYGVDEITAFQSNKALFIEFQQKYNKENISI